MPWLLLVAVVAGATAAAACSTSTSGTGPEIDAATGSDASSKLDAASLPDVVRDHDAARADTGPPDPGDATVDADDADEAAPDSAPDVAPPPCDGLLCNGTCLHTADCSTCTGAKLLCVPEKTCVEQCSFCRDDTDAALAIECFACDSRHANPIGTCESAQSSYCLGGDYFGGPAGSGYHCACPSGNASECPGSQQVCFDLNGQNLCATCGEPIPLSATGGTTCNDPGTSCDPPTHTCQ